MSTRLPNDYRDASNRRGPVFAGLRKGLAFTLQCWAVVFIVYLVSGLAPFAPFTSLPPLLGVLLAIGLIAGFVVGWLHRWRSSVLGRAAVGAAAAGLMSIAVGLIAVGIPRDWTVTDWTCVLLFAAIGAVAGIFTLR